MFDVSNILFIHTLIVLREELEEKNKDIDELTTTNDQLKDDIKKLKGEKKEKDEKIKQLTARVMMLEDTKENPTTSDNGYQQWRKHAFRFQDEMHQQYMKTIVSANESTMQQSKQ